VHNEVHICTVQTVSPHARPLYETYKKICDFLTVEAYQDKAAKQL